jgi:DNA repair exonuclease SbcCD ATPase subunit
MDKDAALRKQVTDEVQEQYESRLKQAKRQKQQAEEELETVSERWRTERRKLNAEIDRLEAALTAARESPRRRSGAGGTENKSLGTAAVDPALITKIKQEAQEQLNNASAEWETERTRMKSQIGRLENAVAEAIERSSNPMRASQSLRETFETELARILHEKSELEQAFLRAKTEWEQEKLQMTGEMVKLRRTAQIMGKPVPRADAPELNSKVVELEARLKESVAKWNAERENFLAEIHKLDAGAQGWEAERRQLNDHAGRLQQAFMAADAKAQAYDSTAPELKKLEGEIHQIKTQRDVLQAQFDKAKNEWDSERRRLQSQVQAMEQELHTVGDNTDRVSKEVVDQLRTEYERQLQDAIEQRTRLTQQLQEAGSVLQSEQARLQSEIAQMRQTAEKARKNGRVSEDTIAAEIARTRRTLNEIIALIDDPETELATIIRKNVERAELDAYLKGIIFSTGGEH